MIDFQEPPAVSQPAPDRETVGNWSFWERRDPITDKVRAGAGIVTEDGTLSIKCDEAGAGSVYVSFSGGEYFGSGRSTIDRRPVLFRLDDKPPVQVLWRYGDSSALLIDNPGVLTGPLMTASRITIRAMTYRYVDVTRTFDPEGADVVVPQVYEACGDRKPDPIVAR